MRLIFGLGNPGPEYQLSRHNVGFLVVDELAARAAVKFSRRRYRSLFAHAKIANQEIILIKPQTFMNLSGQCVLAWVEERGLAHQDIVVVGDDLDLDFGRLRFRKSGGDGGHRGLLSIIESLGTKEYLRLKVGVGRPAQGIDPQDYVLSPFLPEESEALRKLIGRAADGLETFLTHGLTYAMNHFHRQEKEL